jgi:Ca-activated chloride channel homolog
LAFGIGVAVTVLLVQQEDGFREGYFMINCHFLRPWWLLAIIPLLWLLCSLWRQSPRLGAWEAVCDSHLLKHLIQTKGQKRRHLTMSLLFGSALFMTISLAGPTWVRLPAPSFQQQQPKVLVLDMSEASLAKDLPPNRLTRAKFKLHDLFKRHDVGQFALLVYSGEPFVVSPVTEDAQTIDALLSTLSPDIMPVAGQRLDTALEEAGQLISNAGFKQGQLLVLTGETPSQAAIAVAKTLAAKQIYTSVMPVLANQTLSPLFQQLAIVGQGQLIPYTDTSADLDQWLKTIKRGETYQRSKENDIPRWRDEGRWFLLPALLLLLPVFRRGWLQRITT